MTRDPTARVLALREALLAPRPGPSKQAAAFAAGALLGADGDPDALARATAETRAALNAGLRRVHAPGGEQEWVYAAILTASGVRAEDYLSLREALHEARPRGGAGRLHARGTLAALVLATGDRDGPASLIRRFYRLKDELRDPWWRRDLSEEDALLAGHAATGHEPREAQSARERAEAAMADARGWSSHRKPGARLAALLGADPGETAARNDRLHARRRTRWKLRMSVGDDLIPRLAAQGFKPDDLDRMLELMDALKAGGINIGMGGQARLAAMIVSGGRPVGPGEAAAAFAAVQAAQTAVMVASMAAVSAAATSSAGR
jgi:hypothetical protein